YNQPVTGDLAATLSTTGGGPQSGPSLMAPIAFHPTQDPISSEGVVHALGTGSAQGCATAAVAFNWQQGGGPTTSLACNTEQAPTMQRSQSLAVAFRADAMREGVAKTPSADAEGRVRLRDPGMGMYEELAPTLDTGAPHGIAFAQNSRSEVRFQGGDGQIVGAVTRVQAPQQQTYIASHMQVRRLTPLECCRLQGFPDTYLDITYRGKPAADGPKYKALGNSMAVPVMRWIGERIAAVEAVMQREEVTA
ncbi:MAG: DNA cytosine methyltransferase, partial [Leptolyngbyaceae bacterium]|nr:DNA cytosine methyltransferase [Leptolyngbyaceae bacterium]